jgi:hypothetical protein
MYEGGDIYVCINLWVYAILVTWGEWPALGRIRYGTRKLVNPDTRPAMAFFMSGRPTINCDKMDTIPITQVFVSPRHGPVSNTLIGWLNNLRIPNVVLQKVQILTLDNRRVGNINQLLPLLTRHHEAQDYQSSWEAFSWQSTQPVSNNQLSCQKIFSYPLW